MQCGPRGGKRAPLGKAHGCHRAGESHRLQLPTPRPSTPAQQRPAPAGRCAPTAPPHSAGPGRSMEPLWSTPPNWMHQQRPAAHAPNCLQEPRTWVSANQHAPGAKAGCPAAGVHAVGVWGPKPVGFSVVAQKAGRLNRTVQTAPAVAASWLCPRELAQPSTPGGPAHPR